MYCIMVTIFRDNVQKAQRDNERERVAAAKREAIAAQKKKVGKVVKFNHPY